MRPSDLKADENFELLEELGVGGFAQTFKARVVDEDLADRFETNIVALKIPLTRKKEMALTREVELNTLLRYRLSPEQGKHLVRYLGLSSFDGKIVMAMQLASGSLRSRLGKIGQQKQMPVDEVARIVEGVLDGLAVIHGEKVLHRDIKPENILMDGETPKVSDFGISRILEHGDLASTQTGTVFYMSPEVLFHDGATFTSDIWSVGVMLYEMLAGELPCGGLTTPPGAVMARIRSGSFTPVCEIRPSVPAALGDVVAKALKRKPRERFADAAEMAAAIREALGAKPAAKARRAENDPLEKELADLRAVIASPELSTSVEPRLLELLRRHPNEPRVYQYLGEYYNRCQRHREAVDTFKKGIAQDRSNALLHWNLALAYQQEGNKNEAKQSLEHAIALGLDPKLQRHATNLLRVLQR